MIAQHGLRHLPDRPLAVAIAKDFDPSTTLVAQSGNPGWVRADQILHLIRCGIALRENLRYRRPRRTWFSSCEQSRSENFGLGGGYSYTKFAIEKDDLPNVFVDYSYRVDGPQLYLILTF